MWTVAATRPKSATSLNTAANMRIVLIWDATETTAPAYSATMAPKYTSTIMWTLQAVVQTITIIHRLTTCSARVGMTVNQTRRPQAQPLIPRQRRRPLSRRENAAMCASWRERSCTRTDTVTKGQIKTRHASATIPMMRILDPATVPRAHLQMVRATRKGSGRSNRIIRGFPATETQMDRRQARNHFANPRKPTK